MLPTHDSLTGLMMTRAFTHAKKEALKLATPDFPLAWLRLSIDGGFHKLHESRGYDFVDQLLLTVATILKEIFANDIKLNKNKCTIARAGGEDFEVLLPGWNRDQVEQTVAKIAVKVEAATATMGLGNLYLWHDIKMAPFDSGLE